MNNNNKHKKGVFLIKISSLPGGWPADHKVKLTDQLRSGKEARKGRSGVSTRK